MRLSRRLVLSGLTIACLAGVIVILVHAGEGEEFGWWIVRGTLESIGAGFVYVLVALLAGHRRARRAAPLSPAPRIQAPRSVGAALGELSFARRDGGELSPPSKR